MILSLLIFTSSFAGSNQGWINVDKMDKVPIHNNTIKITTDSIYGGDDVVYFELYTRDDQYDDVKIGFITWRFKDWSYCIEHCTPYAFSLKFTKAPPIEVDKIWEITLTIDDVRIKCNKEEVLHFVYNNTYNARCTTDVWNKTTEAVEFHSRDATKTFYLHDYVGWIAPMDDVRYRIFNSSFKIATRDMVSGVGEIEFGLYTISDRRIIEVTIHKEHENWMYELYWCTPRSYNLPLTNVPTEKSKTWFVTATEAHLNIKCNGVEVLHFVYDDSPRIECKIYIPRESAHAVEFSRYRLYPEIKFFPAIDE